MMEKWKSSVKFHDILQSRPVLIHNPHASNCIHPSGFLVITSTIDRLFWSHPYQTMEYTFGETRLAKHHLSWNLWNLVRHKYWMLHSQKRFLVYYWVYTVLFGVLITPLEETENRIFVQLLRTTID